MFLKDRQTSIPLSREGRPFRSSLETTCILFDTIAEAQQFCEAQVIEYPNICCEVLDAGGRAHPPLLVIEHPDCGPRDESPSGSRRRKLIAAALLLAVPLLLWLDWRRNFSLILPTFLAFNCILTGLRFLYWDFGVKQRERERLERLERHRKIERGQP